MEPSPSLPSVRFWLGLRCRTVLLHTPGPDNQNRSLNYCQRYGTRGRDLHHDVPDKETPCISGIERLQGENGEHKPRRVFGTGCKVSSISFPVALEEGVKST